MSEKDADVLYANGCCYRHVRGSSTYTITEISNPDVLESRKPAQHSSWCALHRGGTTCDCDWFEKEGRL